MNQIITNPKGIPWCKQWIINEDIPNGTIHTQRPEEFWIIEGLKDAAENQYIQSIQETIFIQKEWFEIQVPTTRTTWGRILTGI